MSIPSSILFLHRDLVHDAHTVSQRSVLTYFNTGEEYNEHHGNKWPLELMRLYLEGSRGVEAADRLFADIEVGVACGVGVGGLII